MKAHRASDSGCRVREALPRQSEWFWHGWGLRWLTYLCAALWVQPRADLGAGPLLWVLLVSAGLNLLALPLLRSGRVPYPPPPALIAFDFTSIALMLALGQASLPSAALLFALPLFEAALAGGWAAALSAYSAAALFTLATHWSLLRAGSLPEGPGPILLLLALITACLGVLAGAVLREAGRRQTLERTLEALSQVTNHNRVLGQLVAAAADLTQAEKVLLLVFSAEGSELIACEGVRVDPAVLAQSRLPADEGIVARTLATGESYRVAEARADPQVNADFVRLHAVHSLMMVPLRVEARPRGLLVAMNHRAGVGFSPEELRQFELLAAQSALVLEYRDLQRALICERMTLQSMVGSLSSGVVVTDARGCLCLLNPAAEHLLQTTEAEAVGRTPSALPSEGQLIELLERAQRSGAPVTEEVALNATGNLIVRVDCCPVRDPDGALLGHVALFNDVTELRMLDLMKRDFVSAVSHELRTPLTSVKAYTSTLLRADFDRETQVEFLNVINEQCDRLTQLINDLLSISKIESGTPLEIRWTRIDLARVIERVVHLQQGTTAQHRIETVLGPELTIEGDEDKLERVLANLVNNAIKYSPSGGKVRVVAEVRESELWLSVSDQGIGISPDQSQVVFGKFYQVDSSHTRRAGGSGLGLFLVKHMVEAHGGEIWVESELGAGSTFICRLPLRRGEVLTRRRTASVTTPVA